MKELRKYIRETLRRLDEIEAGEDQINLDGGAINSFIDSFQHDIESMNREKEKFKLNKKNAYDTKEKAYFDHMEKEREKSVENNEEDLDAIKNVFQQAQDLQKQNDAMKQAQTDNQADTEGPDINKDMLNIS